MVTSSEDLVLKVFDLKKFETIFTFSLPENGNFTIINFKNNEQLEHPIN